MHRIKFACILTFVLFLQACAGTIKPYQKNESNLLYGKLIIKDESDSDFYSPQPSGIFLQKQEGMFDKPTQAHISQNGVFFFENLEPGEYYLGYFTYKKEKYNFISDTLGRRVKETFPVKKGDMIHLGEHKLTIRMKSSLFGMKTEIYDIKKSTGNEKKVLEHLKRVMKEKGWSPMIDDKL